MSSYTLGRCKTKAKSSRKQSVEQKIFARRTFSTRCTPQCCGAGVHRFHPASCAGFIDPEAMLCMTTHSALEQENVELRRGRAELNTLETMHRLPALGESEARYRLLADNAADVIWILDAGAGRFTYVSPSVERQRGYTPAEVLDQPLHEVMTPSSLALINADLPGRVAAFLNGDPAATVKSHEIEQLRKDGGTVWTEVKTTLLLQPDGVIYVLGVSRDISERRAAEAALRASEERYRTIFDGANEGIIAVEPKSQTIAYVNRAMCALFGYTEAELLGLTIPDLHPSDAAALLKAEFGAATRSEKLLIANFPCRRKDGVLFLSLIHISEPTRPY